MLDGREGLAKRNERQIALISERESISLLYISLALYHLITTPRGNGRVSVAAMASESSFEGTCLVRVRERTRR